MRFSSISFLLFVGACGGGNGGDAGLDLSSDLYGPDYGHPDFGPSGATCTPTCGPVQMCCGPAGGAGTCASVMTDPENCGTCGVRCADGRGTACVAGHCVCGISDVGCVGASDSTCCPPVADGGMPYCASFLADSTDCGGCGHHCDARIGGTCSGGECHCGTFDATTCLGTAASSCCVDGTGQGMCADTTTDRFNCGGCGIACQLGETCNAGQCSVGTAICTGCDHVTDVCCHGVCCSHDSCRMSTCGALDAGAAD